MASLNTSTNGPSIKSSYQGVISSSAPTGAAASSSTYGQWALFSVSAPLVNAFQQDSGGKESVLKVQSTGEGELIDLIEDFSEGRVQFAFVKVKDPNTTLPKYVLIGWCGEGVPERTKGYFTSHLAAVSKILHGYHVQITARSDRDLNPESIVQKVADASGAKYSNASGISSSSGPPPPIASKPVFNPTRPGTTGGFNPIARSRAAQSSGNADEDGWGADAPQVTRTQLEKVAPAYQRTVVDMKSLTSQGKPNAPASADTSGPAGYQPVGKVDIAAIRAQSKNNNDDRPATVKGAYEPIGKVDIAAIRAQARGANDDRPTTVKGAYEPIGKVDIAAIKAQAKNPSDYSTPSPNTANEEPPSVSNRSAAFSQPERLTSMPKPKVANKFGSSATGFTGTKAPTPGAFGLQSAAPAAGAAAPVGAASRTFADEGGKTPAQIWAEKKARERGTSGAGDTAPSAPAPITSQASGGGEWKSGYTGKSWAPVATTATGRSGTSSVGEQKTGGSGYEQEETPASPVGGIGALKDRFKGGAPMGAPVAQQATREASPPPPPIDMSSRPGAMPGLPIRPPPVDDEEEDEAPSMPPRPPVQARSPTPESPERAESPVRIAMPVSRSVEPEPEEFHPPPAMPVPTISHNAPEEEEDAHDSPAGGKRAVIQYDYEKAEDNELELVEGEYVTNIEMVDDDWWMGTNSKGESGLFPSNYVELVEDEEEEQPPPLAPRPTPAAATPAAAPAPSAPAAPTAIALYDYEAAEDNELSFGENDVITGLEFPDEDWWFGHFGGKSGLFPSNYVDLQE